MIAELHAAIARLLRAMPRNPLVTRLMPIGSIESCGLRLRSSRRARRPRLRRGWLFETRTRPAMCVAV